MLIGQPNLKKLPYNVQKRCQQLRIQKVVAFQGTYENTLKLLPGGAVAYPVGNSLLVERDKQVSFLKGHDNQITTVALSNSGTFLITGQLGSNNSKNYESPLFVWDIKSKQLVRQLPGLKDGIRNIVISRDDGLVAASSCKNHLMVWSLKTMAMVHSKAYEFKLVLHSFQEGLLVSIDKGLYELTFQQQNLPVQTALTLPSNGLPRNYSAVALFQPRCYFIGTEGGELCVFEKNVFKSVLNVGKGKVSSIYCGANEVFVLAAEQLVKLTYQQNFVEKKRISLPGSISIVGNGKELLVQARGRLYSVNTDSLEVQVKIDSHSSAIVGVDSKDKLVVSLETNGLAIARDPNNWNIVGRCSYGKPLEACCLALSQDSQIVTGWIDGSIKCFSLEKKGALEWQLAAHKQRTSAVFANENYIVSGGEDAIVRIWARKSRQLLQQISVHQKTVSKVFPDAKLPNYIHSCSQDKSVHTYDLKTDKKVNFHQAKNGQLLDMGQRKDNGDLITCGANVPISFWDLKGFPANAQIEFPWKLQCLAVQPSGKYVIFGCENGEVYVFEIATREFIGGASGHSQPVTAVKWLNDKTVISGSSDASLVIWSFGQ